MLKTSTLEHIVSGNPRRLGRRALLPRTYGPAKISHAEIVFGLLRRLPCLTPSGSSISVAILQLTERPLEEVRNARRGTHVRNVR